MGVAKGGDGPGYLKGHGKGGFGHAGHEAHVSRVAASRCF